MTPSIGLNLRVTGYCNQGGRKYMEDVFRYVKFGFFEKHTKFEKIFPKPFQNKKCQKDLRYPTKKQTFLRKKTTFLSGTSKFFDPSYFDMALPKLS